MTLPYSSSIITYIGNGLTFEFPFSFKVWNSSQLRVVISDTDDNVIEAKFSATLNSAGGVVTYLNNSPLPAGWKLSIVRNMPFEQLVDLITGTRFDPQVIESSFDYIYASLQQLDETLSRTLRLNIGTSDDGSINYDKIIAAANSTSHAVASASLSAKLAMAWAESPTPPDAELVESKSAKTWVAYIKEQVDSFDAKMNQMLTLKVAFIPSFDEQGAVDYNPTDGLLSFIVPYGARGEQGVQGVQGIQGDTGLAGLKGAGEKGDKGIQGIQGTQGEQGIQGIQGIKGDQGLKGDQGNIGIQGLQGSLGLQGIQGGLGAQGIKGDIGTQGIKGGLGLQGTQGIQGLQGEQGERGIQGIKGGLGTQGIQGLKGLQGTAAPAGIQGDKGEIGDSPWASAFGHFRLQGASLLLDYVGTAECNTFFINDNGELEVTINGND